MKSTSDTANNAVTDAELTAGLATKVSTSLVGAANGVASLGADSKVPAAQLPSSLTGSVVYKGLEDASDGSFPSGTLGDFWIINVAGTVDGTLYSEGDSIVYSTVWDKMGNSAAASGWTDSGTVVNLLTGTDNVGINSADPRQKLDVDGNIYSSGTIESDDGFIGDLTGNVTGNVSGSAGSATGNAATATALQTARTINGKSFDGTANITITQGDIDLSLYARLASPTFTTPNIGVATGSLTGNVTGNLTGTADYATRLTTDPSDCTAGQYAAAIDAYGNFTCSTPSGGVSGLTTNYISKATSATALGNSLIIDNGTNVGISSAVPRAKLDVNGTIYGSSTIQAASGFTGALTGNASTATALAANGTNCSAGQAARGVDAAGAAEDCFTAGSGGWTTDDSTQTYTTYNVGIGSATPRAMLDVDGEIYGSQITLSGAGQSYCGSTYTSNCVYVGANASAVRIDPAIYTTGDLEVDATLYIGDIDPTIKRQNSPLQVQSVALGTTPFNIFNAANYQIFTVQESATGTSTMELRNATATANIQLNSTWHSYFNTGNSAGFIIGGTTPTAKLDVGGFTRTSLGSTIDGTSNASVGVKGSVEIDNSLYVDTSIYLTAADTGSAGGFYISQPDGGCSKCGVDNAGTTWSCANITCPTGM
jgi:hypothetical protein